MMVNNSTNINKTNNPFSPHVTEQKRKRKEITAYPDQKSRSVHPTGTKMRRG
jgi:hypothetical protein